MAKEAGPDKFYVDAAGHYLGVFRDVVDSDTRAVLHPVSVPSGAVKVTSAPPGEGYKWQAQKNGRGTRSGAWVADPEYAAPTAEDGETRIDSGNFQVRLGGRWRNVALED